MTLWLDAQLPPALAGWFEENLQMQAVALRDLGLRDPADLVIFEAARNANVTLISKDATLSSLFCAKARRLNWSG